MRTQLQDDTLTIYLEGRLGTGSMKTVQDELLEAASTHPGKRLVLDASDLEYIASSGLRVLMNLFNKVGEPVPIINVNPQVYEVFDLTGFTELTKVQKKAR